MNIAKTQSPRASIIHAWTQVNWKITPQTKNHRRRVQRASVSGPTTAASFSTREPRRSSLTFLTGRPPMATGIRAAKPSGNMTLCVLELYQNRCSIQTQAVTIGLRLYGERDAVLRRGVRRSSGPSERYIDRLRLSFTISSGRVYNSRATMDPSEVSRTLSSQRSETNSLNFRPSRSRSCAKRLAPWSPPKR